MMGSPGCLEMVLTGREALGMFYCGGTCLATPLISSELERQSPEAFIMEPEACIIVEQDIDDADSSYMGRQVSTLLSITFCGLTREKPYLCGWVWRRFDVPACDIRHEGSGGVFDRFRLTPVGCRS